MPAFALTDTDRRQLEALLEQKLPQKERRRARALILVCNGATLTQAAERMKIRRFEVRRTAQRWRKRRSLAALQDYLPSKRNGPLHQLDAALFHKILELDAPRYGYDTWSAASIADYLRQHLDLQVASDTVHDRLERHGYRFNKRRKLWLLTAAPFVPSKPPGTVALPIPRELKQLLAKRRELTAEHAATLLPGFLELCILKALSLQPQGLTVRCLSATLQGHVNATSLTNMLYALRTAGCLRSEPRPEIGALWQLLPHGACVLRLLTPWVGALYEKVLLDRLFRHALPLLFFFEPFTRGLTLAQLSRALRKEYRYATLRNQCARLVRAPGLLARERGSGALRGQIFFKLTPLGQQLLRLVRALLASKRDAGALPASEQRALARYRPPLLAKGLRLPALALREPVPTPPRFSELLPRQADLRLLRILRPEPRGLTLAQLREALPRLTGAIAQRRLHDLQRQRLVSLHDDQQWRLTRLGSEVLAVLEQDGAALYVAGYLPKQLEIEVLMICAPASEGLRGAEAAAAAAQLGFDPRWVAHALQAMVKKGFLQHLPAAAERGSDARQPRYRVNDRGARAYAAFSALRQMLTAARDTRRNA